MWPPPRSGRRRSASTRRPASELLQEAHVVLEEQAQVGNAVLEHGDALDPHPEGEALDALGVVALHVAEHVWVHHPRAQDLDPARALAQGTALAVRRHTAGAVKARHVDLHAGP